MPRIGRRRWRDVLVAAGAAAAVSVAGACGRRPAAPRQPASIVLVTIDTLRADHVTARLTPALDRFAKEAVVFDQAVTVAPLTLPAHASLLTGSYPPRTGVRDNQVYTLPADAATYTSFLKQRGYATAAFVSAVVLDHQFGLDRGFDRYDDEIAGPERAGAETVSRAAQWIGSAARPFFVWIHLFEPHAPYRTGSYEGEVTAADAALAALFDALKRLNAWNDVVVSVSADHGESLGEHGEKTHGFFLYDATLRIPWILKAPGVSARHAPQLVRIVDEMPTIVELATGSPPSAADGASLAPWLRRGGTQTTGGDVAYSETLLPRDQFGWSALSSVRTDTLKYIEAPRPELYDLAADPGETINIVESRAPEAARLKRIAAAIARPSAAPDRDRTDPLLAEKLMSLGYVGYSPAAPDGEGRALADPKDRIEVYNLTMDALEESEKGDVLRALKKVGEAEKRDPNVAQIEFLKGTLFGRMGRYDQAVPALERSVELNPRYTAARFRLALALLRVGRADRAEQALRDVVNEQPNDFRAWHNLAAIAYSRGDLDEAEKLERKAVAISPTYAEAWNTLGAIALVRRQTDVAIDALTKATTLNPKNAQAFRNLSMAFRAAGDAPHALAAADRACAIDRQFCTTTGGRQ